MSQVIWKLLMSANDKSPLFLRNIILYRIEDI